MPETLKSNVKVQPGGCTFCGQTGVCPECGGAQIYNYETCVCHSWMGGGTGVCPICSGNRLQPAPVDYDARMAAVQAVYQDAEGRAAERDQQRAESGDFY